MYLGKNPTDFILLETTDTEVTFNSTIHYSNISKSYLSPELL